MQIPGDSFLEAETQHLQSKNRFYSFFLFFLFSFTLFPFLWKHGVVEEKSVLANFFTLPNEALSWHFKLHFHVFDELLKPVASHALRLSAVGLRSENKTYVVNVLNFRINKNEFLILSLAIFQMKASESMFFLFFFLVFFDLLYGSYTVTFKSTFIDQPFGYLLNLHYFLTLPQ